METYSIGLMYQHQSDWYNKSWLESQLGKARTDAQRELEKKYPGLRLELRNIAPGETTGHTVKDQIVELVEKFDLVIFEFSDNNPNVMIEFGVRLSSKRPYLIIKNEECTTHLPSNVANEYFLAYSTKNDLFYGQLAEYIVKIADLLYVRVAKGDVNTAALDVVSIKKKTWLMQDKLFEIFVDHKGITSLRADFYKDVERGYIDERFRYTGMKEAIAWNNLCFDISYRPYWDSVDLISLRLSDILEFVYRDAVRQIDFVCLGVGSGFKEKIILDSLLKRQRDLNFFLVDASIEMLGLSLSYYVNHLGNYEDRINAVGILCDLNSRLGPKPAVFPEKRPSLFALLGNTIGNYSEQALIRSVTGMMEEGDYILIDAQLLPKDIPDDEAEREIRKSYDNVYLKRFVMTPLLRVKVGEDDGEVEITVLRHHPQGLAGRMFTVRYDWIFSREVEGMTEQSIHFPKGSRIGLGFSVKYDIDALKDQITKSGLRVLNSWVTKNKYYGIVLAQRA